MINILLGYVVPFILLILSFCLIKTYRDERVIKWVKIAVNAAEQMYKESGKGAEKFDYVKNWIKSKFHISDEDLKNIIESAVYNINNIKGGE